MSGLHPTPPRAGGFRSRVSLSQPSAPTGEMLRRFSVPSPYSANVYNEEPAQIGFPAPSTYPPHATPGFSPGFLSPFAPPPCSTEHRYTATSRGKDYALITVKSRAPSVKDKPLLHVGDEVSGFITFPRAHLEGIQSIEVVLQEFNTPAQVTCAVETKRRMMPQDIDPASIYQGSVHWGFSLMPSLFGPPSSASSASSIGPGSSSSHDQPAANPILSVTVHRRGRLTQNAVLVQEITYVAPSDTPHSSPGSHTQPLAPIERRNTVSEQAWKEQKFPTVVVKGVLARRETVEVECKLVIPFSYPVGPRIPLRMTLTSTSLPTLDLVATSQTIDVRMYKVVAFGPEAAKVSPLMLRNRKSYHLKEHAATARWHTDGSALSLPADDQHLLPRWRIRLRGELHWKENVEMTQSLEVPDMVVMYVVCILPFKANDFHPSSPPDKELFIGRLDLTAH